MNTVNETEWYPPQEPRSAAPSQCRSAGGACRPPFPIGPYRVERELGRGAMGIVYAATDTRLGRRVALKMIAPACAADPEAVSRLEHEAKLLAQLNHPGIATAYSLEDGDGCKFLTLELVPGKTLAELIAAGMTSTATRLELLRQVAEALHFAHEHGVLHGDLKPSNVVVAPSTETTKILDFGMGRAIRQRLAPAQPYVVGGTPGYMSPELLSGRTPDERADTFAFGCLLFETLVGRKAFHGSTVDEVLAATIHEEADLDALPGEVPASVVELLEHCLQKDPSERLADLAGAARTLGCASMGTHWREDESEVTRVLERSLKVGDRSPRVRIAYGGRPLLLTFFRGNWCWVCVEELVAFERQAAEIRAMDARVVAVSPQLDSLNRTLCAEKGLSFPVLSDPRSRIAKAFGVAFPLPAKLRAMHRSLGLDLARYNGDDSWTLPMPATFVIDRAGTISYAATSPDPTVRPDPRHAVEAVRAACR